MPELSWAPRWPLAAASRREITEAALTSLSAHATTVPSPSPPPSPDPFPPPTQARPAFLPTHPPWTRPRCEPSQICQMMASSCRTAPPANSYQPFFSFFLAFPHPSVKPAPPEKSPLPSPPPPHIVDCFTFRVSSAFPPSASSWFVLLPATSKENQGSRSHRHGI